jgi:2-desacetyl-2-hydroxyethyl bacteriochlorophyllide A dehydrogenase
MSKMMAVMAYGAQDFRYEEVDIPQLQSGDILVKVEGTGICASDRSIYKGGDPWGGVREPHIPGHEFVGEVVEIGTKTTKETGIQVGDRATAEIIIPCRKCFYCTKGFYHLCIGERSWVSGSWAEYMLFPKGSIVYRVPKEIPPELAAIIEPLSCSCHAVNRADVQQYDTVTIAGLGSIGMGALQITRLRSPYQIIGLEIDDELRKKAKKLGADYVFDPRDPDLEEKVKAITEGRGTDKYIECSGNPVSLNTAFKLIRKRGRVVVYGVYRQDAVLDFNQVGEFKEFEIVGGHLSPWSYNSIIKYLQEGKIDGKALVTHVYPLSDFINALSVKWSEPSIKTVMIPGG